MVLRNTYTGCSVISGSQRFPRKWRIPEKDAREKSFSIKVKDQSGTSVWQISKFIFLGDKAFSEQILFHASDLSSHVKQRSADYFCCRWVQNYTRSSMLENRFSNVIRTLFFSLFFHKESACTHLFVLFGRILYSADIATNLKHFCTVPYLEKGNNVACGSTLKHGIRCVEFWCIEREQKLVVTGEGVHIARGACVAGERLLTVPLHLRLARSMCTRPMRNACLFANFQMRIDSSRVTAPISAPVA